MEPNKYDDDFTEADQAWEDSGRALPQNPIIDAYLETILAMDSGQMSPEDGLNTIEDVLERWIWYLAEGEQEVSWHRPVLEQADRFFQNEAEARGVRHRPVLLEPLA